MWVFQLLLEMQQKLSMQIFVFLFAWNSTRLLYVNLQPIMGSRCSEWPVTAAIILMMGIVWCFVITNHTHSWAVLVLVWRELRWWHTFKALLWSFLWNLVYICWATLSLDHVQDGGLSGVYLNDKLCRHLICNHFWVQSFVNSWPYSSIHCLPWMTRYMWV